MKLSLFPTVQSPIVSRSLLAHLLLGAACVLVGCGDDESSSAPLCGDGTVDEGEACDDGNEEDGDGCSASCTVEVEASCGDGNVDVGETCDDGNEEDGDGCSSS